MRLTYNQIYDVIASQMSAREKIVEMEKVVRLGNSAVAIFLYRYAEHDPYYRVARINENGKLDWNMVGSGAL